MGVCTHTRTLFCICCILRLWVKGNKIVSVWNARNMLSESYMSFIRNSVMHLNFPWFCFCFIQHWHLKQHMGRLLLHKFLSFGFFWEWKRSRVLQIGQSYKWELFGIMSNLKLFNLGVTLNFCHFMCVFLQIWLITACWVEEMSQFCRTFL